MGLVLKGMEIENFKSYTQRQRIRFSDLSVLLGANSSGKSTALQALLTMKQTMECNSPDEELLLSGKYVALGDFDDVISVFGTDFFSFSAVLEQTEKSENTLEEDDFRITWNFKRGEDGTSAALDFIEIHYEDMQLVFTRAKSGYYDLLANGSQHSFGANVNNLQMTKYYMHYDLELNRKASELLNDLSHMLVSQKIAVAATDKLISVESIQEFYMRLLNKESDSPVEKRIPSKEKQKLAERAEQLIDDFGNLELPKYETIARTFPKDLRLTILGLVIADVESTEELERLTIKSQDLK